jgi:phage shock protein A
MNVFHKIKSIVRGKTEAVTSEEELIACVDELDDQVRALQQAVERARADEQRLRMDIEDHLTEAGEWEKRALVALDCGDEELATQALSKKDAHETRSVSLQKARRGRQANIEKLNAAVRGVVRRIEQAQRACASLLTQCESTATVKSIDESFARTGDRPVRGIIQALSDKLRRLEAQSETTLVRSASPVDASLATRCADLECAARGRDALEQLKARQGPTKDPT